jgi:hypothetical protein
MSSGIKKSFSIAATPRRQVSDAEVARLEQVIEQQGEGNTQNTEASSQAEDTLAAPAVENDVAPLALPPIEEPIPAAPRRKEKAATMIARASGTRKHPHVRKTDGISTRSTSIHIPVALGKDLGIYCAVNEVRQNDVIVQALTEWLKARKATHYSKK